MIQDVLAHCFLDGGVAVVVGRGGIGGGADGLGVVGRGERVPGSSCRDCRTWLSDARRPRCEDGPRGRRGTPWHC